jgi:hypothetical protein
MPRGQVPVSVTGRVKSRQGTLVVYTYKTGAGRYRAAYASGAKVPDGYFKIRTHVRPHVLVKADRFKHKPADAERTRMQSERARAVRVKVDSHSESYLLERACAAFFHVKDNRFGDSCIRQAAVRAVQFYAAYVSAALRALERIHAWL